MQQASRNGEPELRILVAAPDPRLAEDLEAKTNRHAKQPEVTVVDSTAEVEKRAKELEPAVVLVDVRLGEKEGTDGFEVVRDLVANVAGLSVLLVTPKTTPEGFRRALQVGARDMLQVPVEERELHTALDAALEVSLGKRTAIRSLSSQEDDPQPTTGITVFSTKGGTGKTFVATNLAAGLARAGKRVALVDLDLQSGDAAIALGLVPQRTIFDLVQTYTELDEQLVSEFLLDHDSGLHLLPAPLFPDQAESITPDDVVHVLDAIREAYDYIVIDTAPFFEERILVALEWADIVLHVGSMDLTSIKNMKVTLSTLDAINQPRENVRVIMNRADSRVGLDVADAEKQLDVKVNHTISSSVDVPRALNAGETVLLSKPDSRVAKELAEIVQAFERNAEVAQGRSFGFLRRR